MRRLTHDVRRLLRIACSGVLVLTFLALPVAPAPGARAPRHERIIGKFHRIAGTELAWQTPVAASAGEFGLVGTSWPESSVVEGHAELRTSVDGRTWTGWMAVDAADNGPDRGSREDRGIVATEPLWVQRARFAQVRWSDGTPPAGLAVHLIDPGSEPRAPRASAEAAPGQPGIIPRAQWGADESIRRCCPTFAPSVNFAVVHHTVSSNSYSREQSASIVRGIYEYHVRVNGWDDIGYHFLVDRYGQVFEGRSGGIRDAVIGAHAEGFNTGSTGVSLIGSFQSQDPPAAMTTALANVLAWKLDVHHVDPRGSTTVVSGGSRKYPAGQSVRVNAISAHRDLQETTCPGDPVIARLPALRTEVYGIGFPKIFTPKVSPAIFSPNGDGSSDVLRVTAALSEGATWRVRVLTTGGEVLRSWEGVGATDVRWDGLTQDGQTVHHGYYAVDITATSGGKSATPAEVVAGLYRDPWGSWTRVGSQLEAPGAPRVAAGSGLFHLLTRDGSGVIRRWPWNGSAWGTGARLGTSEVAATDGRFGFASAKGVLHAVIRDPSSNLLHGRVLSNGTFAGWSRIGRATDRGTDVALVADKAGNVHVLTVGMSGNLFASRYNGSWSSWRRVGASNDKGTHPVLAAGEEGDVLAAVIGGSAGIYANKLDPGRGWRSRWSVVGRSLGRGSQPTVTAVDEGFLAVVRGQSTPNLWQSTGTIGRWSAWGRIGSASDTGFDPAVIAALEDVVLVVRGRTSGRLYSNVRGPDGVWRGWDEAGDSIQNGASPTLARTGNVVMVAAEVPGSAPATALARPPLRPR